MDKLLIIADDLTGACDTAVQFAGKGILSMIFVDFKVIHDNNPDCDVLAINTSSRHNSPEEARIKVKEALKATSDWGYTHIYKKTDSVLRGNVGAELEALLKETGAERLHYIPAHPAMGRFTRKGIQYVGEKRIHETDFARDPLNPIRTSNVIEILKSQSKVKIDLAELIPEYDKFRGILIHDASSMGDLETISNRLKDHGELSVCAGPSGFASFLPERLEFKRKYGTEVSKLTETLLIVNGSMHPVALSQVQHALKTGLEGLKLSPADIRNRKIPERMEKSSVIYSLQNTGELVSGSLFAETHVKVFSEIAVNVWKNDPSDILMVIGGDTLLEILQILNVKMIRPLHEILPGLVLSEFEYQGENHFLISKPGSFGKTDVLSELMKIIVR